MNDADKRRIIECMEFKIKYLQEHIDKGGVSCSYYQAEVFRDRFKETLEKVRKM